jgi:hypothetical protein
MRASLNEHRDGMVSILEAVFDGRRGVDEWAARLMDAAAHVAAILLELERAGDIRRACRQGGSRMAKRRLDRAMPSGGVRDRIERVAATDFTGLIAGAIGPEPHPNFIDVFDEAPFGRRSRPLARAGEDGAR